ncbi:MAG: Nif3-like dinuclear metal center hexameric protein [Deltaproteobacteria bacterium]|nr:Nif3-like dinuclear metal center hexameric protein [Deltaproteobacteria bacterium]
MSRSAPIRVRDIWRALDERYPFTHRAEWDNVGILLGDIDAPVRSVVVALDATPAAIAACRRARAGLLVTHHPAIFTPLSSVRPGVPAESAAYELIRMGVAVISAHTNADAAPRGVSHALARRAGLQDIVPLIPGEPQGACKVTVFTPPERADDILAAVASAGGARIGEYRDCSFRAAGTGSYRPSAAASPWRGRADRLATVAEVRLETVVAKTLVPPVLRAVRSVHPYEEPAVDVVPLANGALGGGIGVVGNRKRPAPLREALDDLCARVRPSCARVAGPREKVIRRVAVVAGSGAEFVGAAREAGADLFVTGDVKYHQALDAAAGDMPVVDIGHGSGEKWILPEFRKVIAGRFGGSLAVRVHLEEEPLRPYRPGAGAGGKRP